MTACEPQLTRRAFEASCERLRRTNEGSVGEMLALDHCRQTHAVKESAQSQAGRLGRQGMVRRLSESPVISKVPAMSSRSRAATGQCALLVLTRFRVPCERAAASGESVFVLGKIELERAEGWLHVSGLRHPPRHSATQHRHVDNLASHRTGGAPRAEAQCCFDHLELSLRCPAACTVHLLQPRDIQDPLLCCVPHSTLCQKPACREIIVPSVCSPRRRGGCHRAAL